MLRRKKAYVKLNSGSLCRTGLNLPLIRRIQWFPLTVGTFLGLFLYLREDFKNNCLL